MKKKLRKVYEEKLKGTKGALLLDSQLDVIKKIGAKEIVRAVKGSRTKVAVILLKGATAVSLINLCDEWGTSYLAAAVSLMCLM